MSFLESFHISPANKSKHTKEKSSSSAGNLARAFTLGTALSLGVLHGASDVHAETEVKALERTEKLETEDDWLKLAKDDPSLALAKLKTNLDAPYIDRIAEIIFETDPQLALSNYEDYQELLNANKHLEKAVKTLLSDDKERAEFYVQKILEMEGGDEDGDNLKKDINEILKAHKTTAHLVMLYPETVKKLEGSELYLKESAEKSPSFMVMAGMRTIFENLPKSVAESITQNATMDVIRSKYPYLALAATPEIEKYLPNARMYIDSAIDATLAKGLIWVFIARTEFLEAVPEDRKLEVVEKVLRIDPLFAYIFYVPKTEEEDTQPLFAKIMDQSNSPEAVILRQIHDASFPLMPDVEMKLPIILDEFVYNKRFTIEEAVEVVKDKGRMLKLIGEIIQRKNYIGRDSIARFLNQPVTNKIVDAGGNPTE